MNYLVFVNGLGSDYKGDNIYEFIFTNSLEEVWDETWGSNPSNGYPKPPVVEYISKVGRINNSGIDFELIQNSDFFGFTDSIDGVIALAWEKDSDSKKRLVFNYGDTEQNVEDKLYERDIILEKII